MKVSAIDAAGVPGKGHAYGLVRQLQEGTFNGASIEKHTARFADRLSLAPEAVEELDESEVVDTLELGTSGVEIEAGEDEVATIFQNPIAPEAGPLFGGVGTYVDLLG